MNSKKSSWMYLGILVIYLGTINALAYSGYLFMLPSKIQTMLPELLILVPTLIIVFCNKKPLETFYFHRMRFTSYLLLIVFVILIYPLIAFTNLFSQLFVENVVVESIGSMTKMGFGIVFFMIAVMPPVCEELTFRGGIYGGYRKDNLGLVGIVASSLMFGLFHMNLNQAPYAFLIGLFICLANEATGSILAGMFIHFVINGSNVASLFLLQNDATYEMVAEQANSISKMDIVINCGELLLISIVTVPLAICLLQYIAKRQGRNGALISLVQNQKSAMKKIVSVPLLLGFALNIGYMIWNQM